MAGPTFGGESKVRAPRRPESRRPKLTRAWALGSVSGPQSAPRLSPRRDVSMGIAAFQWAPIGRENGHCPLTPRREHGHWSPTPRREHGHCYPYASPTRTLRTRSTAQRTTPPCTSYTHHATHATHAKHTTRPKHHAATPVRKSFEIGHLTNFSKDSIFWVL